MPSCCKKGESPPAALGGVLQPTTAQQKGSTRPKHGHADAGAMREPGLGEHRRGQHPVKPRQHCSALLRAGTHRRLLPLLLPSLLPLQPPALRLPG